MKGLKTVALFLAVLLPTAIAGAEEMKFAYVDMAKLFDQYEKTKAYDKVLEGDNTKFVQERDAKIAKIRELQGKAALLKDEEKAKTDQEIETLKADIVAFNRTQQETLTKNRDEKVREILAEIEKTVGDYAKAQGIAFVLQDRAIIFGRDKLEITDQILKQLNAAYAKEAKK